MLFCIQQNNLFKAREEKYQSRIRVLEALASGTNEESEVRKMMQTIISGFDSFEHMLCLIL